MAKTLEPIAESAGAHLVTRVPTAGPEATAGSTVARLRGATFDTLDAVYITDPRGRLLGLVRLPDLFTAPEQQALAELMMSPAPAVLPEEDQERVASLAIHARVSAVPVVDGDGLLLGAVPPQALIDILRREHIEDLHRLTGIARNGSAALHAMEGSPLRRARERLPWLLVGLLGSVFATYVVSRFGHTLEAQIAVAFFVPGIVYLADAIGTQTEAITVRGLSFQHGPLPRLLASELSTGLLIGLCLGLLVFPIVLFAFGRVDLALAVSLAILAAGAAASSMGLFLPWLFSRFGLDPAFGSGPVGTIIQDVISLLIYFALVTLLVV